MTNLNDETVNVLTKLNMPQYISEKACEFNKLISLLDNLFIPIKSHIAVRSKKLIKVNKNTAKSVDSYNGL